MANELVPVDIDRFPILTKKKEEEYEKALTSLILGKTPRSVVFQRPIRGGTNVDYVPVWWFIEQLNSLFNHMWDFKIIRENIGAKQVWILGELTVKLPDGQTVTKSAYGGSDIKKYSDKHAQAGEVIDIADDLKSAASDSLKKAATLLGMAKDIYGQREVIEQTTGGDRKQLDTLYKLGLSKGMDKEAVDKFCAEQNAGKKPDEVEAFLVLGLMAKIRAKT